MSYVVKEIFYTLQGEGANSGRAAVFCRFAGCNLWSGREEDREGAICRFCDTDFVGTTGPGGGRFSTPEELAMAVAAEWRKPTAPRSTPFVVCTGGEPLLQIDEAALSELKREGFEIAIETNGTLPVPVGIDWVCVSPKANADLLVDRGDELKLIFPQSGADPAKYAELDFQNFFLQPMDGPQLSENTALAVNYCMDHPQWKLSLQTHKVLGIP